MATVVLPRVAGVLSAVLRTGEEGYRMWGRPAMFRTLNRAADSPSHVDRPR